MITKRDAIPVTRLEFYSGLAAVWLFIGFLAGRVPSGSSTYLLQVAAVVMFIGCAVQVFRARLSRENDTRTTA